MFHCSWPYLRNHQSHVVVGPNAQFELTPVLSIGIFIGVLTALVCIAFGTALALKLRTTEQLRRRRLHQQNDSQFDKPFSRPGNLPIKDKISLPLGVGDLDDIYDDKNPDVVPYNEGKGSRCSLIYTCLYRWAICSSSSSFQLLIRNHSITHNIRRSFALAFWGVSF